MPVLRLEAWMKVIYTGRQEMLLPEGTVSAKALRQLEFSSSATRKRNAVVVKPEELTQ